MEWPAKGTGTQLHTSAGFFKVHQTDINPSVTTLIFNRTAILAVYCFNSFDCLLLVHR